MKPLENVRPPLMDLHRTLLEAARRDYERVHGRQSSGDFLQALIADPSLQWIKPFTELVASLDQLLGDKDFHRHYADALQRHPELVVAHGKLLQATKTA